MDMCSPSPIATESTKRSRLRLWALLPAFLLIPFNAQWVFYCEVTRHAWPTNAAPFFNVVFWLFCLAGVNVMLKRFAPRFALRGAELMANYVMLSVATAISSFHLTHSLIAAIAHPYWFASPKNGWEDSLLSHLPPWLVVSDTHALKGYFFGDSSFWTTEHLRAWLVPLTMWTLFIYALGFMMLAMNLLLRKQWTEAERLSFPLVELPYQMLSDHSTFFRNRLMWIGFAVAGGIELCNGLHVLFPVFPAIPVKRMDYGAFFTTRPWNSLGMVGGLLVALYPFAIGLSFLMPLDLAFSSWIFFLLHKGQYFVGSLMGWTEIRDFPYTKDQQFGACAALFALIIWSARRHLKEMMVNGLWSMVKKDINHQSSIWEYRLAFLTFAFSFLFLLAFSTVAGMTVWVAVVFLALYVLIAVVTTRIRVELGFPVHDMYNLGPPHMLVTVVGTQNLGQANLVPIGLFNFYSQQQSNHPMPHQLEGLKLADREGAGRGEMTKAILLAIVICVPVALWSEVHTMYRIGAGTAKATASGIAPGVRVFETLLPNWTNNPEYRSVNWTSAGVIAGSFLFTLGLAAMRSRFLWWSLHPLGYAVANSWGGIADIWTCVVIGSVVKWTLLRYGGLGMYRKALPFFLGLIVGDFVVGGLWLLIGLLGGVKTYVFWL